MNQPSLLNAREAAARLGVKLDTLYAYVSRGLLRSVAVPESRERHYRPEDVERFRAARRSGGASGAESGAESGGMPAMPPIDSAICLIEGGRLYYRGQDAIRLSDSASVEEIAALLWGADSEPAAEPRSAGASAAARQLDPIARCQIRLATLAAGSPSCIDFDQLDLAGAGRRILRNILACLTAEDMPALSVHRQLAGYWQLDETGADLVRRCLVLIADHEFNASTFTARCVASTGAPLAAAVSAALGALSGPRHGGATARVEAIFRAEQKSGDPIMAVAGRLARGEQLPGIGHPLYPDGDPRAVSILYALSLNWPQARRLVGYQPNVDFALGATVTALGLPAGAALSIFLLGRTVGWIAHAIEQYEGGDLIRPRARYTGPAPVSSRD
jgi:citrate synthase